jgi:uncharacterized damage-inducible protein DinB
VAKVPDAEYRKDRGAFFKSLHGTLDHLLVTDRMWMRRFTSAGELPPSLDAILYDDFETLRGARHSEDIKIVRYVHRLSKRTSPARCAIAPLCARRRSSSRSRQRSITSSITRRITAARRTHCCLRCSAMTRRRALI